jgi:acyl-CoA dehydrogenase
MLTPLSVPEPAYMTDELRIFKDSVERFMRGELSPKAVQWEADQEVDRDSWLACGSAGILMASAPEELGGGGGGFAHEAVISEASGRLGLDGMVIETHNVVIGRYLTKFGSEEQKRGWIPRMASGEAMASIAMTEPNAGSDLQAIRTTAIRRDDDYVINGQKIFITSAASADIVILAGTNGSRGARPGYLSDSR